MSTPVQRQHQELKSQNPDAILFFRLGDFYEMFYEDALTASRILGIALTARHRGTENEMPMCGFPYHAYEEYLEKLIQNGYKVAIAEQIENSETKEITRKVIRVVTPGTVMEDQALDAQQNSFLAAIIRDKKYFAISFSDITTGDFKVSLFENAESFFDELYKLNPSEILVPSDLFSDESFCKLLPRVHLTPRKMCSSIDARKILQTHFGVAHLDLFGIEKLDILIQVSALILRYLSETIRADVTHITKLIRYNPSDQMQMDIQTFRHLEIFEPLWRDESSASLFSLFERSCTAMGSRQMRQWFLHPLIQTSQIRLRLDSVMELTEKPAALSGLTEHLRQVSDLERIMARLVTGRGSPRDFGFLRDSFEVFPSIHGILRQFQSELLFSSAEDFIRFQDIFSQLDAALVDHPPMESTEGGIFRSGVSEKLDELRELSEHGKLWLEKFLEEKKKETKISNLRIKYSNTFGFCLEVSSGQTKNVPNLWVRRQTLVNAERYTTPELAEHEEKVLSAQAQSYELEQQVFEQLRQKLQTFIPDIQHISQVLGVIDTLSSFARTAIKYRWMCPEVKEETSEFIVEKGRHPVVEALAMEPFIANDLRMDTASSRLHLLTGPNMAGKSTFLRQNALCIFLAQIGSFVPAEKMRFSPFDRIFTRVGASDNLAAGKSTFFVEMTETAKILNSATEKSFIILDEIGRGTSTFDGISIAWAVTEFLHDHIKAKTLFATHYHELIDLIDSLAAAQNFHVSVSQNENGIVFLHRIAEGGISDSFGIEVARLAGLPKMVIAKAHEILTRMENENLLPQKPTLFSSPRVREKIIEVSTPSEFEVFFKNLNPEEMSPKEALDAIFKMQKIHQTKI